MWAEEVESRIDAYDRGELESVSLDEIMDGYPAWHKAEIQRRENMPGDFSDWNDVKQKIRKMCCSGDPAKKSEN